jgi:hypothetical protein
MNKIIGMGQQTAPEDVTISNGTDLNYVVYTDELVLRAKISNNVK